jgi:hypothetical protein
LADPEHPVLALQHDLAALGQHVGDQGRQADPEIDINPVFEVLRGAPGDLLAIERHGSSSFSIEVIASDAKQSRAACTLSIEIASSLRSSQ